MHIPLHRQRVLACGLGVKKINIFKFLVRNYVKDEIINESTERFWHFRGNKFFVWDFIYFFCMFRFQIKALSLTVFGYFLNRKYAVSQDRISLLIALS